MTNLQQSIEQQVGVFVRNVNELVRRAAIVALEQATVIPAPAEVAKELPRRKRNGQRNRISRQGVARKPGLARDPAELSALTERLYGAIVSQPGETMDVLAPVVGSPGPNLRVSIGHLVTRGRVKKVGERRSTRYFPMDSDQG
jgi:hypothetical protein